MVFYSRHADPDYKTMVFYSVPLLYICEGHFSNSSPGLMLRQCWYVEGSLVFDASLCMGVTKTQISAIGDLLINAKSYVTPVIICKKLKFVQQESSLTHILKLKLCQKGSIRYIIKGCLETLSYEKKWSIGHVLSSGISEKKEYTCMYTCTAIIQCLACAPVNKFSCIHSNKRQVLPVMADKQIKPVPTTHH